MIAIGAALPWLIDRLTANEVLAEIINDVLASSVGAAINAVKSLCTS